LWVAATDGSGARQITFEHDPAVAVGVPVWSPTSNAIAFILTRAGVARQWIINADGSGLRELGGGLWGAWSHDGQWLYTIFIRNSVFHLDKTPVGGGASIPVRNDDVTSPALAADGTLFFASPIRGTSGVWQWAIRKARPESGAASTLAHVSGARIPVEDVNIHPILSPDGKWLVQPLLDGATSNLWLIDTESGTMRRVTDYGNRPTVIGRRVAWSRDSRSIYAAIAHTDSDIVLLRNVRP
jgi:Tol biopolymer transport system component